MPDCPWKKNPNQPNLTTCAWSLNLGNKLQEGTWLEDSHPSGTFWETVRAPLLLISLDHHCTLPPVRSRRLPFHSGAFPTAFTEIPPLWSIQIDSAKHPNWARSKNYTFKLHEPFSSEHPSSWNISFNTLDRFFQLTYEINNHSHWLNFCW